MRKKAPKNLILEGVGLNLGRVWDALGSLVVTFGRILTLFWTFKIISCKSIGPRWAPRGLLDGFWVALERFWDGLGRVWGGIWKGLEPFEQGMDRFWICLAWFGLAAAEFINWTPALIREASQYSNSMYLSGGETCYIVNELIGWSHWMNWLS